MIQLLVYEKIPRNAAVLARWADAKLQEVRSLRQLKDALKENTPQIVAIELMCLEDLGKTLQIIRKLKVTSDEIAVIVILDEAVEQYVNWVYEAGADLIFRSMLDRAKVIALSQSVERRTQSGPSDALSLRQQVFAEMPWKRWAT